MKAIKLFALSAVALLSVVVSSAQTFDEATEKYSEAMAKAKEQAFEESYNLLREAMMIAFDLGDEGLELTKEIQRQMPKMQYYMGIEALKARNFQEAINQLLDASDMADLYGDVTTMRQSNRAISAAYQQLGTEAFNNKDFALALESFSKGHQQDPSNIQLSILTAKSHAELGDLEQAVAIYNEVITAGEENSKFANQAEVAKKDVEKYVLVAASEAAKTNDVAKVKELVVLAPQSGRLALLGLQVANNAKSFDYIIENAENAATLQEDPESESDVFFMLAVAHDNKGNKAAAVSAAQKVTAGNNVAAAREIIAKLK